MKYPRRLIQLILLACLIAPTVGFSQVADKPENIAAAAVYDDSGVKVATSVRVPAGQSAIITPSGAPLDVKWFALFAAITAMIAAFLRVLSLPDWKDVLVSLTFWDGVIQMLNEIWILAVNKGTPDLINQLIAFIGTVILPYLLTRRIGLVQMLKLAIRNGDVSTHAKALTIPAGCDTGKLYAAVNGKGELVTQ